MSYASFLRNVPEILSQPTGIAALASLGIHGAIAFILPLMPVESSKTAKQSTTTTKPIGLSELSSNEQSRIPNKAPNQPGIQSQLPPLPNQIPALPSQQQLPLNLSGTPTVPTVPTAGTTTGLPPSPPAGSTSSGFSPLPKASSFNLAGLPRGGSPVQKFNRKDLAIDPSNYGSTPIMSSRTPYSVSSVPRSNIRYRQSQTLSRADRPSDMPSMAQTNVPVVEPPPLSTDNTGLAALPPAQPGNEYNAQNGIQAQNNVVRPDTYIAPVDKNPASGNGNLALAPSPIPSFQPQTGGLVDSVNNQTGAVQPGTNTKVSTGSNQEKIDQTILIAKISEQFRKEYPQGQFRAPVRLSMDKSKLENITDVSVIMNGEGKIADFKLLGDASKISFEKQQAIRQRLQQYFKENPTSTNGKGALFSFRISPDNVTSTEASDSKDSLQNTPKTQSAPSTGNIFDQLSGVQSNRQPVTVPSVNTPTVSNTTNNSVNSSNNTVKKTIPAPALPGTLKPISTSPQGNQTAIPQLPSQKPSSNDIPQTLSKVQPAPIVAPKQPVSETATKPTTPEAPKTTLANRLRSSQSSDNDSQSSLVEKLRKVKQQRENENQ